MRSVYLDTTIPSYYVDEREELALHVRRTREWWDTERQGYAVYVSQATLEELLEGVYPRQAEAVKLLEGIPILEASLELPPIVEAYLGNRLMPARNIRDAIHLAFASFYKMDFLLTWNCRHLANANKRRHIEVVNSRLGLATPAIITPLELVPEEEEPE